MSVKRTNEELAAYKVVSISKWTVYIDGNGVPEPNTSCCFITIRGGYTARIITRGTGAPSQGYTYRVDVFDGSRESYEGETKSPNGAKMGGTRRAKIMLGLIDSKHGGT